MFRCAVIIEDEAGVEGECSNFVVIGEKYCINHSCLKSGCKKFRQPKTQYCRTHASPIEHRRCTACGNIEQILLLTKFGHLNNLDNKIRSKSK
jgi:hypothetical protein